jgi:hypothetical protein
VVSRSKATTPGHWISSTKAGTSSGL